MRRGRVYLATFSAEQIEQMIKTKTTMEELKEKQTHSGIGLDHPPCSPVLSMTLMNNPYTVTTLRLDCNFNIEEKLIDLNIP